jgi:SAM-dependent methyltransferase
MINDILYSVACRIPLPRSVYGLLKHNIKGCKTVLDIGCGEGSVLLRLGINGMRITGLDIWEPYSRNKRAKLYEHFITGDIRDEKIGVGAFDLILMTDVLEHIPKTDVRDYVIKKAEAAARKRVVIVVPLGDVGNDSYDGNPYQYHRSIWQAEDLEGLGYKVDVFYRLRRKRFPDITSLEFVKTAFGVKNKGKYPHTP